MERFEGMLTMPDSELARRSKQYADALVEQLEQLDAQYQRPNNMSEQAFEDLRRAHGGKLPGPTAAQFHGRFQRLFCEAIASQYVIVPDGI
jgi:hypothetical protein